MFGENSRTIILSISTIYEFSDFGLETFLKSAF